MGTPDCAFERLALTLPHLDVTENIKKVEEQLEKGEEKLASLLVVQRPEILAEDGEPIIEIREELDEAGNIICNMAINSCS